MKVCFRNLSRFAIFTFLFLFLKFDFCYSKYLDDFTPTQILKMEIKSFFKTLDREKEADSFVNNKGFLDQKLPQIGKQ